jgi:hypothetical protein
LTINLPGIRRAVLDLALREAEHQVIAAIADFLPAALDRAASLSAGSGVPFINDIRGLQRPVSAGSSVSAPAQRPLSVRRTVARAA